MNLTVEKSSSVVWEDAEKTSLEVDINFLRDEMSSS